ncbi:MAG: hypothetical protein AB7T31_18675 [Gemmatimonadales bacterium]
MRRVPAALGLVLSLIAAPATLRAQDAGELAARCAAAGGDATLCAIGAGAGRDLAGYVGILAGPGSSLSGQASTLGRRLGGAPRLGASARVGGISALVPDLADASGSSTRSPFVPAVDVTLAFGLFDGLSVLPTVGGVFSVDVFASGGFVFFPADQGFDGKLPVLSAGARVGLLRESFTLPAVTLSVARRFNGDVVLGDVSAGDLAQVGADPGITSVRATVGKDLFAFGVLAGAGWDDFSSRTTLRASDGAGSFTVQAADVEDSRRTYFLGLSKQLGIISWISGEVGWVEGFEPVAGGASASPDAGRQLYGSVALVLRL